MKNKMISVTIISKSGRLETTTEAGTRLRTLLDREAIDYSLPCGGEGKCGGCRVRFLEGAPMSDVWEELHLSEKEESEGYRILCRTILDRNCVLELGEMHSDLSDLKTIEVGGRDNGKGTYGIAVDLGTTTIGACLIKQEAGGYEVLASAATQNHQRKYGSDVISRIAAAEDKAAAEDMERLAASDIEALVKDLAGDRDLKIITIAGNTTMLHLLNGYDVSGLGKYPYTPYALGSVKWPTDIIFKNIENLTLCELPGISAFVGADIVAGLYTIPFEEGKKFFFLDLGTNGEMAYYDGEKLKVTSAAAGPVFEAGGISCGMASVPGAISHVEIGSEGRITRLETIEGQKPVGICGTGVMEITSELVRCGIIDETGLLSDEYFDEGFPLTEDGSIRFTQQDIRNVQLAKAAIFTGIQALLEGQVPDKVYIAGGFGSSIDPAKIANLKMFPGAFDGKIACVGNTSLKGAAKYTAAVLAGWDSETDAGHELELICDSAQVIELAARDSFDEEYLEAMNF